MTDQQPMTASVFHPRQTQKQYLAEISDEERRVYWRAFNIAHPYKDVPGEEEEDVWFEQDELIGVSVRIDPTSNAQFEAERMEFQSEELKTAFDAGFHDGIFAKKRMSNEQS